MKCCSWKLLRVTSNFFTRWKLISVKKSPCFKSHRATRTLIIINGFIECWSHLMRKMWLCQLCVIGKIHTTSVNKWPITTPQAQITHSIKKQTNHPSHFWQLGRYAAISAEIVRGRCEVKLRRVIRATLCAKWIANKHYLTSYQSARNRRRAIY